MPRKLAARVRETTITEGTIAYVLAGAVSGHRAFATDVADGETVPYCVTMGADYELGIGTFDETAGTIARTTIRESSNSDAAVNWAAGTKEIFICVHPSDLVAPYARQDTALSNSGGDMTFWNATDKVWNDLPIGTPGKTMTVNSDNEPSWQNPPPLLSVVQSAHWLRVPSNASFDNITDQLTVNRLYSVPFIVPQAKTFDRIGCVVAISFTGGSLARLGIYDDDDGLPNNLILDAGTVLLDSVGDRAITISQALNPGRYHLALVADDDTGYLRSIKFQQLLAHYGTADLDATSDTKVMAYVAHTFGALPDPFGTPSFDNNGPFLMGLRVA